MLVNMSKRIFNQQEYIIPAGRTVVVDLGSWGFEMRIPRGYIAETSLHAGWVAKGLKAESFRASLEIPSLGVLFVENTTSEDVHIPEGACIAITDYYAYSPSNEE